MKLPHKHIFYLLPNQGVPVTSAQSKIAEQARVSYLIHFRQRRDATRHCRCAHQHDRQIPPALPDALGIVQLSLWQIQWCTLH